MKAVTVIPNFLSKRRCKDLIAYSKTLPQVAEKFDADGGGRDSEACNIPLCPFYGDLSNRMRQEAMHATKFSLRIMPFTPITVLHYKSPGNFTGWHVDGAFDESKWVKRKASALVMLSDPDSYEGGDLEFAHYLHPKRNIRKQGTLLVFPSFLFHQVTPMIAGERYTLGAFFTGPEFR